MKNQIILEIKNSFNQVEFKLVFLMILISLGNVVINCLTDYGNYTLYLCSFIDNSMYISIKSRILTNLFAYLSPVIVMFLYASCKWNEKKNGMSIMMMSRGNAKTYYYAKFITNFILILTVMMFSGLLNLFLNRLIYPLVGYDNRWGLPVYDLILNYESGVLFDFLRVQNPMIYILVKNFFISIFLAVLGNIPYVLSFIKYFKNMSYIKLSLIVYAILTFFVL